MTAFSSSSAQPFSYDVVLGRDEVVVTVMGELDLAWAGELERAVSWLRGAGHERIVIDLRDVEFMDSTGLRVLIGLQQSAEREGRRLTLVPGPRQVQRIFELTATLALFDWRA